MDTQEARTHADGIVAAGVARHQAVAAELFHITELAQCYRIDFNDTCQYLADRQSRYGGMGTPRVSEFFTLELAPLLRCSVTAAASRLSDALNLRWRHRSLWDAVQALELDPGRALRAAEACTGLPQDVADAVGRRWAGRQGRLGWRAAFTLLDKLIAEAAPETVKKQEDDAATDADVKISHCRQGRSMMFGNLDTLDAVLLDGTLDEISSYLKNTGTAGTRAQLRAKSLGILAIPALALKLQQLALQPSLLNQPIKPSADTSGLEAGLAAAEAHHDPAPWWDMADRHRQTADETRDLDIPNPAEVFNPTPAPSASSPQHTPHTDTGCLGIRCGTINTPVSRLLPKVQLVIHINADDIAAEMEGESQGSAWIEHIGTITIETLAGMLNGRQVVARPVIDLNTQPAENQYRPSRRLTEAVHLLHPYETFPYSTRTSRNTDLDHTVAYQPRNGPGQTRLANLTPLTRRIHRAKTIGAWQSRQPTPDTIEWTSPLGYHYTTSTHGTHTKT